jgi:hypothetical protein
MRALLFFSQILTDSINSFNNCGDFGKCFVHGGEEVTGREFNELPGSPGVLGGQITRPFSSKVR